MTSASRTRAFLVAAAGLGLAACATIPTGPSVLVLPGRHASFEQFQADDYACRDFAFAKIGGAPGEAVAKSGITGAAIGAGIGAATGAAIGAATGDPGTGAAVGAGSGLLLGSAAGAAQGATEGAEAQRRYDYAYMQCMYAKGHQIPVRMGSGQAAAPSPLPRRNVPAPPPGAPPGPPPHW
jgi:Glycine-zipper domain